jgi:hypothetical protein
MISKEIEGIIRANSVEENDDYDFWIIMMIRFLSMIMRANSDSSFLDLIAISRDALIATFLLPLLNVPIPHTG